MIPFISDMPPLEQSRIVCSITAAIKYEIPANLVLAVAEKEGGKPGQKIRNSNGTYDIGSMQFNTTYLKDLKKYGITSEDVASGGCYPFELAAWRIRGHIQNDKGDIWTKAANYHSRTKKYNIIYRNDLMRRAIKWADWLDNNFENVTVANNGSASLGNSTKIKSLITESYKINNKTVARQETNNIGTYTPRTVTFK